MSDKDVTEFVKFGDNDGEFLPLIKCVCGQEFVSPYWLFTTRDKDLMVCPECGRKLYFQLTVKVFEVVEDNVPEKPTYSKLSCRQQKILEFISKHNQETGYPPTIREIGKEVGISSTSAVNYNLNKLVTCGYLIRDLKVSRGLKVVEQVKTLGKIVSDV